MGPLPARRKSLDNVYFVSLKATEDKKHMHTQPKTTEVTQTPT